MTTTSDAPARSSSAPRRLFAHPAIRSIVSGELAARSREFAAAQAGADRGDPITHERRALMKAKDVMTTEVVYAGPETSVRAIARTLLKRRISGVPVADHDGRVIGIVSEGDLMRRPESETARPRSWLELMETPEDRASQYLKSHGLTARDVMTREPITVTEDTPLEEIAMLLERKAIKRVPVLRDGKLVGIVSRADLLHGLVARAGQAVRPAPLAPPTREAIIAGIRDAGLSLDNVNVVVADDAVHLWGAVDSAVQCDALALAAKRTPGVTRVESHLVVTPP
jgi:CBS domain-containing protein